jgi:hypothetical protein
MRKGPHAYKGHMIEVHRGQFGVQLASVWPLCANRAYDRPLYMCRSLDEAKAWVDHPEPVERPKSQC